MANVNSKNSQPILRLLKIIKRVAKFAPNKRGLQIRGKVIKPHMLNNKTTTF